MVLTGVKLPPLPLHGLPMTVQNKQLNGCESHFLGHHQNLDMTPALLACFDFVAALCPTPPTGLQDSPSLPQTAAVEITDDFGVRHSPRHAPRVVMCPHMIQAVLVGRIEYEMVRKAVAVRKLPEVHGWLQFDVAAEKLILGSIHLPPKDPFAKCHVTDHFSPVQIKPCDVGNQVCVVPMHNRVDRTGPQVAMLAVSIRLR
jgi:hypothetical protein